MFAKGSLRIYYGGVFCHSPRLEYRSARFKEVVDVDPDLIDYFELKRQAKEAGGYTEVDELYFSRNGVHMEAGLVKVNGDEDVREISLEMCKYGVVTLFIVRRKVIEGRQKMTARKSTFVVGNPTSLSPRESPPVTRARTSLTNSPPLKCTPFSQLKDPLHSPKPTSLCSSPITRFQSQKLGRPREVVVVARDVDDIGLWVDDRPKSPIPLHELVGHVESDEGSDGEYCPNEEMDVAADDDENVVVPTGSAGVEPSNVDDGAGNNDGASDLEPNVAEDVLGYDLDTSDEECVGARRKLEQVERSRVVHQRSLLKEVLGRSEDEVDDGEAVRTKVGDGLHDDSEDETLTPLASDEEGDAECLRRKLPRIDHHTDFSKLKWKVGICFDNRDHFKDSVIRYGLAQGRDVRFTRSDQHRNGMVGATCVVDCPFKLFGSMEARRACFVLKTVNDFHTCTRDMSSNTQLKASWMAKEFLEIFKVRPHWPGKEIIEVVRKKYRVHIKRGVAYKVKYLAHKMLHGSMKDHYGKLSSYLQAVKDSNPNTLLQLHSIAPEPQSSIPTFQRLFLCFEALKNGLLTGCRRVLRLDGCFLKTFLGGMLLSAIGRDGNNQMFPVCWAVVEGENNDSWSWFVTQLQLALGNNKGEGWTIISDQQKGLLNAVQQVFPNAEHCNCARHIYANWKKTFKGDDLKKKFWATVRAYNKADFDIALADLEKASQDGKKAFVAQNPSVICRAYMSTNNKCDVVVSNMAETFNGYIIHARSLHVIDMLESIRASIMERLALKKTEMEKYTGKICPRVQKKLEKAKEEAVDCTVQPSSLTVFQVTHGMDTMSVDILNETCSCREWDMTGVPCTHAIAAIFFLRHKVEDYVNSYYKKDTYLKAYEGSIKPVPGCKFWPKVDAPYNPPPIKIGPGRPKKNRKKDPFEDPKKAGKLTRHGFEMSCSICKNKGHNKRSCPNKDSASTIEAPTKKPRGRPRKDASISVNAPSQSPQVINPSPIHYDRGAEPSRKGKGRGKGTTTGTHSSSQGRGGGSTRGVRTGNGRGVVIPQGVGIYMANDGNAYQHLPGRRVRNLSQL